MRRPPCFVRLIPLLPALARAHYRPMTQSVCEDSAFKRPLSSVLEDPAYHALLGSLRGFEPTPSGGDLRLLSYHTGSFPVIRPEHRTCYSRCSSCSIARYLPPTLAFVDSDKSKGVSCFCSFFSNCILSFSIWVWTWNFLSGTLLLCAVTTSV